jgi:acyl-CoA reductase-like NAD-dependent aldehyde dehydrogenase
MTGTQTDGPSTTDQAKETAQQATQQAKDTAQQATQQAKETAQQATQQARGRIRDEVDRRSTEVGEQATSAADAIRQSAQQLREQGKETAAKPMEQAAQRVERAGSWLRDASGDKILQDVEDFGRRQPLAVVAGGIAVGFALSRLLKASSSRRYEQRATASGAVAPGDGTSTATYGQPPITAPPAAPPTSPQGPGY